MNNPFAQSDRASEIDYFCSCFNVYLRNRYGYKKDHAEVSASRLTIGTTGVKKFTFYLRFNPRMHPWPLKTLVIAQIGFDDTRIGNGTDFIRFVVKSSQKFGIENIGIESANHASSSLAAKCGFSPIAPATGVHWCGSIEAISRFVLEDIDKSI